MVHSVVKKGQGSESASCSELPIFRSSKMAAILSYNAPEIRGA
jgi:hypothetical protein